MKVSFGESLRRLRMERSLSQQQLGNLLHVDRSTIAKWESGARLPDADMIARLSDCLRAEPGSLLQAPEKDAEKWNAMLVDDEKIILGGALPVLSEALPEAEIYGFTDPTEATAFARASKVQLIFLDIEMGRISGLDVCRKLLEINPRMNVIFLTAYREYALDAWETGACGFLVKPLTVEDTGPGFAPSDDDAPHIALDNIRRRLNAMCGGTLTIEPREAGGTKVTVFVPLYDN